jgi:hypothetical protein
MSSAVAQSSTRHRLANTDALPACKKADIPFDLVYHRAPEH